MHNRPRQVLETLIESYGPQLIDDSVRCRNLLRDVCGEFKVEVNALLIAQEERVPAQLRSWTSSPGTQTSAWTLELSRLVTRLEKYWSLSRDAAQWAVESWALALDVIDAETLNSNTTNPSPSHTFMSTTEREVVYQLAPHSSKGKSLKLRLKRELNQHPPSPIWYEDIVHKLSNYIQGASGKPILLTGYGSFGGSCLTHWAINNARAAMAKGSTRDEAEVLLAVDVNLLGRGYDDFWMAVQDWFDDIQLSDTHKKFKRKLSNYFEELKVALYFKLTERKEIKVRTGPKQEVNLDLAPIHLGKFEGGGWETRLEDLWLPRDEKTPAELQRLRALMHSLPNLEKELQSWWKSTLGKLRGDDGRPFRIVFILDKIDDLNLLKELDPLLSIRGGFRTVVTVDKYYYDAWSASGKGTQSLSTLLTQRFEVLKCRPVWDDSIAGNLCEKYFDLDAVSSNEKQLRDFIDGLNFGCGGSPGLFLQLVQEFSAVNQGYLELHREFLPSFQIWAKIERILRNKKNRAYLLQPFSQIRSPNSVDYDPLSRALLFLNLVTKRAIHMGAQGLTKQSLAKASQEEAQKANLSIDDTEAICERLIDLLYNRGVLRPVSKDVKKTRRPVTGIPQRELHFIWICDASASMSEAGKIQAFNNAVKESIPHLQTVASENPSAKILIRAIRFSTHASWHIKKPTPVERFKWPDLSTNGFRNTGQALSLLAEALQDSAMPTRGLPPVLVLCTDGDPLDDFEGALKNLESLAWWKKSVRLAIAIGDLAPQSLLMKFSNTGDVLRANNPEALIRSIRWVSTTIDTSARHTW